MSKGYYCQMKKAFIFVLSEYESVVVKLYESIYYYDFRILRACLLHMYHYRIFAQKPNRWVFLDECLSQTPQRQHTNTYL